jgi:hypothetical protein
MKCPEYCCNYVFVHSVCTSVARGLQQLEYYQLAIVNVESVRSGVRMIFSRYVEEDRVRLDGSQRGTSV